MFIVPKFGIESGFSPDDWFFYFLRRIGGFPLNLVVVSRFSDFLSFVCAKFASEMEGGSRRLTLFDQMSAADVGREPGIGMIDGVLAWEKRALPQPPPSAQLSNRTLLDVIRDDEPNAGKGGAGHRDRKSWKSFKDRLRLNRAGAAWTSSVPIPTSDIPIPIQNRRSGSLMSRRNSVRFDTVSSNSFSQSNGASDSGSTADPPPHRPQISRRSSSRYGPNAAQPSDSIASEDSSGNFHGGDVARVASFRPQMSRHNSTRFSPAMDNNMTDPTEPAREGTRRLSVALAEERQLSAREAVAAQEAAEAETRAEEEEEEEESNEAGPEVSQPIRMSLMDLLEETDRQMGVVGARYAVGGEDEEEEEDDYEDVDEEEEKAAANGGGGAEHNCCVCMVRHKGSAFIPCGHTFCRLCSRELWVSRGNCPLCNGFILEILDIF